MKQIIKNFLPMVLLTIICNVALAQFEGFNYQGKARDNSGNILANQNITLRISILDGSVSGVSEYIETHNIMTTEHGLFVVKIGNGVPVSGSFANITWAANPKYMKLEIDITGGTAFTFVANNELLTVPYAIYALNSSNGGVTYVSGAGISVDVTNGTITNTAPDQMVTLTEHGATTITGTYPNYTISSTDNINDADADPNNEIQTLSLNGNIITLLNGGTLTAGTNISFFGSGSDLTIDAVGNENLWAQNENNIYYNSGNIGINRISPNVSLDVNGNVEFGDGIATGSNSFAFGNQATASGDYSIAGGAFSIASGEQSVALGGNTIASGERATALGLSTTASGARSFAVGYVTTASGDYSVAMGKHVSTNNKSGSFVFGDASTANVFTVNGDDRFMVRASGGTYFYSNSSTSSGVKLLSGNSAWSMVSDKKQKENYRDVKKEDILEKLSKINIQSWNYIAQHDSIRHIGIMAQDFYYSFGYGEEPISVNAIDLTGISMVAIQALAARTNELKKSYKELEQKQQRLAESTKRYNDLENRLEQLEELLSGANE